MVKALFINPHLGAFFIILGHHCFTGHQQSHYYIATNVIWSSLPVPTWCTFTHPLSHFTSAFLQTEFSTKYFSVLNTIYISELDEKHKNMNKLFEIFFNKLNYFLLREITGFVELLWMFHFDFFKLYIIFRS